MTVLCKCGCGKPVRLNTLNYVRGHNVRRSLLHRIALFWKKTGTFPGLDWVDCIEWSGALNEGGYGVCASILDERLAHRVSYVLSFGKIPQGLEPDHLCRNRKCINPFHLELVSRSINSFRGNSGRHMQTKYNKLTREDVEEIRRSAESQSKLAARFDVSRSNISAVLLNKSWRAREWPKS